MVRSLKNVEADRQRAERDDRDLVSRGDKNRVRKGEAEALLTLASRLTQLTDKQLRRLELEEGVAQALHDARRITSPAARQRQLKIVRRALKAADWQALEAELEGLLRPSGYTARQPTVAALQRQAFEQRVVALAAGGDAALSLLVAEHPGLDRAQLRPLLRQLATLTREEQEPESSGARRERVLVKLRSLLQRVFVEEPVPAQSQH